MQLRYTGPFDVVEVPDPYTGDLIVVAERGATVDVPDGLAERLLAQGVDPLGRQYPDASWQTLTPAQPATPTTSEA